MKRGLVPLVAVLMLVPAVASATELDELLERGREASYSAEQLTTCTTPDGVKDALVRIEQSGAVIRVGAGGETGTEVAVGQGGWSLHRHGGLVQEANIGESTETVASLYAVEDLGSGEFLGRDTLGYRLIRDDVLRAELLFDVDTGALVRAVTFDAEGDAYCDRRFVSFDPGDPGLPENEPGDAEPATTSESAVFPESAAGFTRLDEYEDQDGFRFAYYSDGFFSYAVFEAPTKVNLVGAVEVDLDGRRYRRVFTAGQAIYVWEAGGQGMALVGDLPPDLHEAVLVTLPAPTNPGLFRRIWRSLFG